MPDSTRLKKLCDDLNMSHIYPAFMRVSRSERIKAIDKTIEWRMQQKRGGKNVMKLLDEFRMTAYRYCFDEICEMKTEVEMQPTPFKWAYLNQKENTDDTETRECGHSERTD